MEYNSASGGNAYIPNNSWRVLSVDDGIIQLIPAITAKKSGLKIEKQGMSDEITVTDSSTPVTITSSVWKIMP